MSKSLGVGRSSGSFGSTTAQRVGRIRRRTATSGGGGGGGSEPIGDNNNSLIRERSERQRSASFFPSSIDGLEQVKSLGGSTGAKLVRDPETGRQYVLKRGANQEHLRSEFATDRIYELMGANVPSGKLYETRQGPVKLTEFIEGKSLGDIPKSERAKYTAQLHKHFAVDAVLGNWDVVGLSEDNVLIDKSGKAWRIDNGGSLNFRAQGAKKTDSQWNDNPVELWSMRDPSLNKSAASAFSDISPKAIYDQIFELKRKAPRIIKLAPASTAKILSNRIDQAVKLAPRFKV